MTSGSGYAGVEASLGDRLAQRQFWIVLMIFPGRFVSKPPSKFEDRLVTYAPPQLLVLCAFGIFAPGGLLEYALFTDHVIVGSVGLLLWMPLLWLFLIEVHDMGRARFWLSAPTVMVGHVLLAL